MHFYLFLPCRAAGVFRGDIFGDISTRHEATPATMPRAKIEAGRRTFSKPSAEASWAKIRWEASFGLALSHLSKVPSKIPRKQS